MKDPVIANAAEWQAPKAFMFQLGEIVPAQVLVFSKHLEDALEELGSWAVEHAPGYIVTPEHEGDDPELLDSDGNLVDHTYTEAGWIYSEYWHVDEVVDPQEWRERAIRELRDAGALDGPRFERFDVCLAWYHWLSLHHGGQDSREYARLSKLQTYYRPGLYQESFTAMTENAAAIYVGINEARHARECAEH